MINTLIYIHYNTLCNIRTFSIKFEQFTGIELQPLIKTSINTIITSMVYILSVSDSIALKRTPSLVKNLFIWPAKWTVTLAVKNTKHQPL